MKARLTESSATTSSPEPLEYESIVKSSETPLAISKERLATFASSETLTATDVSVSPSFLSLTTTLPDPALAPVRVKLPFPLEIATFESVTFTKSTTLTSEPSTSTFGSST